MSKNKVLQTKFKASFLLPKYWFTWLGVLVLFTISLLPYRVQFHLGRGIGRLLQKIGGSRQRVAEKNIEVCFPHLSKEERAKLIRKNFENTGIALLETGMGWWWPDWRVKRKFTLKGLEHIKQAQENGQGVLLLAFHNLSLELHCRGFGLHNKSVVFYRPHNNPLMEYFQYKGRGRSNKYMLGKRDVKGLISALHDQESCIYLPDQDYGRNRSVFIPFFNVPDTATTTGTMIFAKQDNVKTLLVDPSRDDKTGQYLVEIKPVFEEIPSGDDIQDLTKINQELEKAIAANPEQYMWLHRRFKTRPDPDAEPFYKK